MNVLGTDYTNWMVGFGVNGPKGKNGTILEIGYKVCFDGNPYL